MLAALCDIFEVTPAQLIATRAEDIAAPVKAVNSRLDGPADLDAYRPKRARMRPE